MAGEAGNRKDEIVRQLAEFDAEHARWMRKLGLSVGRLQMRLTDNPVGRFVLANFTTRLLARLIVRRKLLGIEPARTAPEIAAQWQKLAVFFGVPLEIESATDDEVVVVHPECTMGFDTRHAKLCEASMKMDHEIIRRLGGELMTLETISKGAHSCRHLVRARTAGKS